MADRDDLTLSSLRRYITRYGRVSTAMTYTHMLNRGGLGVRSPADTP
jgi:hypothetical protein